MHDYSVIIPVFNSGSTPEELTQRISSVFSKLSASFEIIFIDDGSVDGSWEMLRKLHDTFSSVKSIRLMRNYGQHNAIMCGFRHASGACCITMDDDGENPPEEIPALITELQKGYDLVYGVSPNTFHGRFRAIGSNCVQFFYHKVFKVSNNLTSFRIISRPLIETVLTYDKSYVFIDGLLAWNAQRIGTVTVNHHQSRRTRSGYSLRRLVNLGMNMFTNFSILPLQISSVIGIICSLSGLITGGYFLVKKIFFGIPVQGFASLIVAITFFSGIQLLTLGIIGEYIGRIHINVNNKAQYHIREKLF